MDAVILTNNPLVRDKFSAEYDVEFRDNAYRDVLLCARDYIHKGHTLLTHPLSGSVKPGETPYKSVAVTKSSGVLQFESLRIIEDSIVTCDKFPQKYSSIPDSIRDDFRLIDLSLLSSALPLTQG